MDDDIAVVGFSFKLPQDVNDVSSFWEVLQSRRNLMTEFPDSRITKGSFEASKEGNVGKTYSHTLNTILWITGSLPRRSFYNGGSGSL